MLIVKNQSSQIQLWSTSPDFHGHITLKIKSPLSVHGLEQILHGYKLLQLHGAYSNGHQLGLWSSRAVHFLTYLYIGIMQAKQYLNNSRAWKHWAHWFVLFLEVIYIKFFFQCSFWVEILKAQQDGKWVIRKHLHRRLDCCYAQSSYLNFLMYHSVQNNPVIFMLQIQYLLFNIA